MAIKKRFIDKIDRSEKVKNLDKRPTSFLKMGIIARIAQVLQESVQLGKIVIEGGHLAPGARLGVRRTSGFTDGFLYRLAVLVSRLQHADKVAMNVNSFKGPFVKQIYTHRLKETSVSLLIFLLLQMNFDAIINNFHSQKISFYLIY